jgi:hypothetical protein
MISQPNSLRWLASPSYQQEQREKIETARLRSTATGAANLALPKLYPAQAIIRNSPTRFRVAACGRRFGKTQTGKHIILDYALNSARCWWLAPTYLMASAVWRELVNVLREMRPKINRSERYIELPGGGFIAVRSTHNEDSLRGEGLDFAVLDEAAFMSNNVWPAIVRPMLLESQGSALFLSTPYGRNWFWDIYGMGLDPAELEWDSFHFTSADNPVITQVELDNIRRNTPERTFREEYLAEFLEDSGVVFRNVRAAATAPVNAVYDPAHSYVFGVDWGRDVDSTAIAVIDATTKQMVALDHFTGIGWALQRGRLANLASVWKPSVIWAEANSIGAPNIEALQSEGLPVRPFQTTATSKKPLIENLALAIERQDVALLPDDTLIHELVAYELERLPSGTMRYSAPPGKHDDTVIALALAWHGSRYGRIGEMLVLDFA